MRSSIFIERVYKDFVYGYIYITTNLVNHKQYIGQHSKSEYDKFYLGSGVILLKAIEKYGKNNFVSEPIDWAENKEELNQKEIWWIDFLGAVKDESWYNVAEGGEGLSLPGSLNPMYNKGYKLIGKKNGMYGKHHDPETLIKISASKRGFSHTDECRKHMSISRMGKNNPNYGNHKLSGVNNPNYGKTMSMEQRLKISHSKIGKCIGVNNPNYGNGDKICGGNNPNSKRVVQLDLNGNILNEFPCIKEAEKFIGKTGISDCCRGRQKTVGGYRWEYFCEETIED